MTSQVDEQEKNDNEQLPALTAAHVKQVALRNLYERAQKGDSLKDADWARLEELTAEEQGNPVADLVAEVQAEFEESKANGKKLTAAQHRALRDAMLADVAEHIWPDVGALAKELGKSKQTAMNWCSECDIKYQRTTIVKWELYRALWLRELEAFDRHKSDNSLDPETKQKMAERQLKMDEREGRLKQEAIDAAKRVIMASIQNFRQILGNEFSSILANQTFSADRIAREGEYRRLILDFIPEACDHLVIEPQKKD